LLGKKYENITSYRFFEIQIFAMISLGILFATCFVSLQTIVVLSIGFFFLPVLKLKAGVKKRKESICQRLVDFVFKTLVMIYYSKIANQYICFLCVLVRI
jgi:hypothetical protein